MSSEESGANEVVVVWEEEKKRRKEAVGQIGLVPNMRQWPEDYILLYWGYVIYDYEILPLYEMQVGDFDLNLIIG